MTERPGRYRVRIEFDVCLPPWWMGGGEVAGAVEEWAEALVARAGRVTCISAVPIADEEGDNPVTQPPKTP